MAWVLTQAMVEGNELTGHHSHDWSDSMANSAVPFMLTDAAGAAQFFGLIEHGDLGDQTKHKAMLADTNADGIEFLIRDQWCVAVEPNDTARKRMLADFGGKVVANIQNVEFWA